MSSTMHGGKASYLSHVRGGLVGRIIVCRSASNLESAALLAEDPETSVVVDPKMVGAQCAGSSEVQRAGAGDSPAR